jgi:hypothetical protein
MIKCVIAAAPVAVALTAARAEVAAQTTTSRQHSEEAAATAAETKRRKVIDNDVSPTREENEKTRFACEFQPLFARSERQGSGQIQQRI